MIRNAPTTPTAIWLTLLLVVLTTLAIRVRLLDVPLERDEGEYAYVAQLLLDGVPPYQQAYTMKLPGVALAYAPFVSAIGAEPAAVRSAMLGVSTLSILLLFLLARQLFGPGIGIGAAASFGLLNLGMGPQALYANTEHFVLLFALAGFVSLLRAREQQSPMGLFASGLMLGTAILMKQHGAVFAAFGGLLLLGGRAGIPGTRVRGEGIAGFALGAALPLGLLCGWIAWVGQWQNFWFWSFRYAREYLGFVTPAEALDFANYGFTQVAGSAPMLWVLSAVGIADALLRRERTPSRVFLYGFTLVSVLALSLGLRFRPHYFLFVLPGVAIWAALGARALGARLPSLLSLPQTSVVGGGILGIALLWGVYAERAYFFEMGPEEVSVANFGRNPFPEALAVGRKLRELSDPGDRIAVLASEPEIYFYAERKSATPFLYTTEVLRRSSTSQALHHDLVASLSKDPPPFLVLSSRFNPFKGADRNVTPLTRWIRNATASGYRRIGVVEIRRGETSRQRWGAAAAGRPSSKAWLMVYQRSAKASSPSGPSL